METVQTKWGDIRVKTAAGFGIAHTKPEYEDVARLCQRTGFLNYGKVLPKRSAQEKGERMTVRREHSNGDRKKVINHGRVVSTLVTALSLGCGDVSAECVRDRSRDRIQL